MNSLQTLHSVFAPYPQAFETLSPFLPAHIKTRVATLLDIFNSEMKDAIEHAPNDILVYDGLNNSLKKIHALMFDPNDPQIALVRFLALLETEYPDEVQVIRANLQLLNADTNVLLKGDIQSGKTLYVILMTLASIVCHKKVLILLRCSVSDGEQLHRRFLQVVAKLKSLGVDTRKYTISNLKKKEKTRCVYSLFSEKNCSELQAQAKGRVLIVDEADLRVAANKSFFKLVNKVHKCIYVSATTRNIITEKNFGVASDSIVSLPQKNEYIGVDDLTWHTDSPVTGFSSVYYIMRDIVEDAEYEQFNPAMPKTVLISVSAGVEPNAQYVDHFAHGYGVVEDEFTYTRFAQLEKYAVISFFESRCTLYHHSLGRKAFDSIASALEHLMLNGGKAVSPVIIIVTGPMGNRGINFAYRHPTDLTLDCHVTHQIVGTYILNKDGEKGELVEPEDERHIGGDSSTKEQRLRCCGNFRTRIPVKVYTDVFTKNVILKNYQAEKTLIEKIQGRGDMLTTDALKGVEIGEGCITSHFCKRSLKQVGLKLTNEEDEEVKELEVLEDEEVEEMTQRFESRASGPSTKIKKFMTRLEPEKVYEKQEMLDLLSQVKIKDSNYNNLFRFHKSAYGKILQRLPDGKCQLHPQLRESFLNYYFQ